MVKEFDSVTIAIAFEMCMKNNIRILWRVQVHQTISPCDNMHTGTAPKADKYIVQQEVSTRKYPG